MYSSPVVESCTVNEVVVLEATVTLFLWILDQIKALAAIDHCRYLSKCNILSFKEFDEEVRNDFPVVTTLVALDTDHEHSEKVTELF